MLAAQGLPAVDLRAEEAVTLADACGVRLSLILWLASEDRVTAAFTRAATAVRSLGEEEAYYWYAKCCGPPGKRAVRALAMLIDLGEVAGDSPSSMPYRRIGDPRDFFEVIR